MANAALLMVSAAFSPDWAVLGTDCKTFRNLFTLSHRFTDYFLGNRGPGSCT